MRPFLPFLFAAVLQAAPAAQVLTALAQIITVSTVAAAIRFEKAGQ